MKNLLITGGTGFVGSSFVKSLNNSKEYKVYSPSSKILNLEDIKSVEKFFNNHKVDYVIHTANHHVHPRDSKSKDPNTQLKNNVTMYFNLYMQSNYYKRLINFGSGGELPRELWNTNIKENDIGKVSPKDQYGLSKLIISTFIKSLKNQKFINLRLFGVFGEFDDWRYRFIPNLCAKAILNKNLQMNNNGIFDFIYIKDVIKTTLKMLNKKLKFYDYNLSTGRKLELVDIANKILKITGNEKLKIEIPNKKIVVNYVGNNMRLKRENLIGNLTPIDESILNVYEHLKKNKKDIINHNF
jgi:GDP-L-fucose synthase